MKTTIPTFIAFVFSAGLTSSLVAEDTTASPLAAFKMYCVKCHGQGDKVKGKVNLLELKSEKDLLARPELLNTLIEVLENREMPPKKKPAPSNAARKHLVARLQGMLRQALKTRAFAPTRLRRMNRFQYNNSVIDLLELNRQIFRLNERLMRRREDYFKPETRKMPAQVRVSSRPLSKDIDNQRPEGFKGVASFPQDKRAEHGFDNRADHLTLSPLLMESFLKLSQTIAESPDLNSRECRSWPWLFAPPGKEAEAKPDPKIAAATAIRSRLHKLLRRAFRRAVEPETVERFAKFAEARLATGATFEQAMRTVVGAILGMPEFLYFYELPAEKDPGNKNSGRQPVSDFELASRLALFLWSSIPDDELLDLAARERLHEPTTLAQQVQRMVAAPRASALVENFAGQWLQLRNIANVAPNTRAFPEFDELLRRSLRRETELFVESNMREDRSLIELLTADYSFINGRLARHYGIPHVYGEQFRHVTFSEDTDRGGLLGQGSILTLTSYPTRTSPVVRGKWLLENILGSPPPPPPPDVPGLPDRGEGGQPASVRERLERHRENPVCATCHSQMDPLGFALEHFDGIGAFRSVTEAGAPVDASGSFPTGGEFEGLGGLRAFILGHREAFAETFIEKLLAYALGRELEVFDLPTVRKIQQQAASADYRWSSIITGIVTSTPFGMRTVRATDEARVAGSTPSAGGAVR